MLVNLKDQLQETIASSLRKLKSPAKNQPPIELEIPNDKAHGEFSSNIALKLAKPMKKAPMELAAEFRQAIEDGLDPDLRERIERIEVKKPGFINFYLSRMAVYGILEDVLARKDNYGRSQGGKGQKIQIEFVSANPTGPLSVAHARQAAVGDCLGNILSFLGYAVTKEYYVNDEGNQINLLGESIRCRCIETLGGEADFPENGYQGDYIRDIGETFLKDRKITDVDQLNKVSVTELSQLGVKQLMAVIKKDLDDFGVVFDCWSHQSKIATADAIEDILAYLGEKGFLYEKDGALWFKSTDFDDDKDRVVEKSDGSYTYLTPDIVYHRDKFNRGFDKVINIWGPDHHGYIPRLTAAVEALGRDREDLKVLVVQLATIFRQGKPVSMSTRRGEYISLREVIDEVGVDVARIFFLLRHINVHLDFDLELAKKESPENPVYYIQYAHARIHSIVKKAKEAHLKHKQEGLALLCEPEELDLIKKIGSLSHVLLTCREEWDPYALVSYALDLAGCFHKFYDRHRVVDGDNPDLSAERLALIEAVRIVLATSLRLLGVSTPEKM